MAIRSNMQERQGTVALATDFAVIPAVPTSLRSSLLGLLLISP